VHSDKWRHAVDLTRVTDKGDAFQHANGADDERKVGRDAEGVVEGDLRQIRRQLLEVDVFCAAALQCLVKHLRNRWRIVGGQSSVKCKRICLVKHLWKRFGKIEGSRCQGGFRIDQSAASSCKLTVSLPPFQRLAFDLQGFCGDECRGSFGTVGRVAPSLL